MLIHKNDLVQEIHRTSSMVSVALTGGGSGIFPLLLELGNGSKTLIDGNIPYTKAAHDHFIGGTPDKLVSEADARALAMASMLHANDFGDPGVPVIGIGSTSSLIRVDRDADGNVIPEREGRRHSIYVAIQTPAATITHSLVFPNGIADLDLASYENDWFKHLPLTVKIRYAEEELVCLMMLNLIAEGCGLEDRVFMNYADRVVRKIGMASDVHPNLTNLVSSAQPAFLGVRCGGGEPIRPHETIITPKGLVPSSLNPPHAGHFRMLKIVNEIVSGDTGFEMSTQNFDKPPLDFLTIKERLGHLQSGPVVDVYLTNTATFLRKSAQFPGCTFGVGHDTAARIVDPKYYRDTFELLLTMESMNTENGCSFIVFGRQDPTTGEFMTLHDIENSNFQLMSTYISQEEFDEPHASRDIRKEQESQ